MPKGEQANKPHRQGCGADGPRWGGAHLSCGRSRGAGVVEKNAVSFFMVWSGGLSPSLLGAGTAVDLAFFLITEVVGLRPEPGREPPLRPFIPPMDNGSMRGPRGGPRG